MSQRKKLTAMVEVLLVMQFSLFHSLFLVEASVRSGKAKTSTPDNQILKEQSSDQISVKPEEKEKLENDQFYYLPLQTVFGETGVLTGAGGLSTTSPPQLNINPAPIQTDYQESTTVQKDTTDYKGPYHSQCVSETPAIELESRFLLPSQDVIKESVIMAGHLEIASKTSSMEEASEMGNIVSKPSVALQGTLLHSHTMSDL